MLSPSPVIPHESSPPSLEEHFLGVTLRRYLDPNWTVRMAGEPDERGAPIDPECSCWIDGIPSAGLKLSFRSGGTTVRVLDIAPGAQDVTIWAFKSRIDGPPREVPTGGEAHPSADRADPDRVEVARWRAGADRLAILHQPIAADRYSLSVFAVNDSDVGKGLGTAQLLLTSFEWSLPASKGSGPDREAEPPRELVLDPPATVRSTAASAPTFLAWTRTNREFDRIALASADEAEPSPLPVTRISGRLTKGAQAGHTLVALDEDGASLHPVSSTRRNRHPIHLQRHLGALLTRLLPEAGRPVEEFVWAGLLGGRETAFDLGYDLPEGRLNQRFLEIETPAAILSNLSGAAIPLTYRKAYFDLAATGGTGAGRAYLFMRFVGSRSHLAAFKKIKLTFTLPAKSVSLEIDLAGQVVAVGLEIGLGPDPYVLVLRSDGSRKPPSTNVIVPPDLGAALSIDPGFFLEVATTGGGEFWADISLLHRPAEGRDDRFSFDWLFSPHTGGDLATALKPETLAGVFEAQARLVSLSSPIKVVRD